ncbi:MAG: hypothetical protein HW397_556 [Dehalococcoidia bacterium]|nr:hypothetical protein [Dehalococcoidia bacterium]
MIIAVIGGGAECPPEIDVLAQQVGKEIALQGHILICGGMGGVMESACKGARSAGGTTIGVLPTGDVHDANPFVDIPIVTGMGYARNVIIARTASAIIAVDGEYGTLSEIAHGLGFGAPVIGLRTWSLSRSDGAVDRGIIAVHSAKEAVDRAVAEGRKRGYRA